LLRSKDKMDNTFSLNEYHCCELCQDYNKCLLKWIRGERSLPQNCCSRCQYAEECYSKIPYQDRVDDDPISTEEKDNVELLFYLSHYICCPKCQEFNTCGRRNMRRTLHLPETCCGKCIHSQECYANIRKGTELK
jgi:hypothetical protein